MVTVIVTSKIRGSTPKQRSQTIEFGPNVPNFLHRGHFRPFRRRFAPDWVLARAALLDMLIMFTPCGWAALKRYGANLRRFCAFHALTVNKDRCSRHVTPRPVVTVNS